MSLSLPSLHHVAQFFGFGSAPVPAAPVLPYLVSKVPQSRKLALAAERDFEADPLCDWFQVTYKGRIIGLSDNVDLLLAPLQAAGYVIHISR